jgi:cyclohexadienyl dehydratase
LPDWVKSAPEPPAIRYAASASRSRRGEPIPAVVILQLPNTARRVTAGLLLAALALGALGAGAWDPRTLRVGTSGDYAPFSATSAEGATELEGFDVAVAHAYAEERGLALEFVRFRWPDLLTGLVGNDFDVAMSGVTVRPERSAAGRFTVPVVETGAVLLIRQPERWSELDELDRRIVRIGVNAGGHLERVARVRFPRATLVSIRDNLAVRRALVEGSLDAAVTDALEAPIWLRGTRGMAARGPFTRDRKAYLVRADRPGLAADLDAWLLARERDGGLAHLRRRHLGDAAGSPVATPLGALLAAIDERLAIMPLVGTAKRETGLPLEVPEREAIVLDAAVAGVRAAAERARVAPPSDALVRALFRAQLEAAKEVQSAAIKHPGFSPMQPLPDLDTQLRPALLRIGERIARLLIALPQGLDEASLRATARQALRTPHLSEDSTLAIANAIARLSRAPREAN